MIGSSTRAFVRTVVADNYSQYSIVNVYQVARLIPVEDGAPEMKVLMSLIAEEAIRLRAAVSWDRSDILLSDGYDANSNA